MYSDHVITEDEHRKWFQAAIADSDRKSWIILLDHKEIGFVYVTDIDLHHRRCTWAFYLAEQEIRGRGIGSFVEYFVLGHIFDKMELEKLCCEVLGNNPSVIEMHKKFGFTVDGVLRRHICKRGQFQDVYLLSILKEEWLAERDEITAKLQQKNII